MTLRKVAIAVGVVAAIGFVGTGFASNPAPLPEQPCKVQTERVGNETYTWTWGVCRTPIAFRIPRMSFGRIASPAPAVTAHGQIERVIHLPNAPDYEGAFCGNAARTDGCSVQAFLTGAWAARLGATGHVRVVVSPAN